MKAPVRAWLVFTPALNGSNTVHVHVIFTDIPFENRERSFAISVRIPSLSDRMHTEIAHSGIHCPKNQKPHPEPFPAGIGVT